MNSRTSKWDKKIIIGIVGLLIVIGLAWATIIISLNNKGSGVVVTPMSVEGEPSKEPPEEIDEFLVIGSSEMGHIDVPRYWAVLEVEGVPEGGFAYGDVSKGESVIFASIDSGGVSLEDYAKNESSRIDKEGGVDSLNFSKVLIGDDVSAFEINYLEGEDYVANYIYYYQTIDGRIGMIHIVAKDRTESIFTTIRNSFVLYEAENGPSPMDEAVDPDDGVDVIPGEEE